jgi:ribosome assembly protein YihI (activator of Der GTPase)
MAVGTNLHGLFRTKSLAAIEHEAEGRAKKLRKRIALLAGVRLAESEKQTGVHGHNDSRPNRLGYSSQVYAERKPLTDRERQRIEKNLREP